MIPISNLLEHINNYSKISVSSYQYCRDEPVSDKAGAIVDFTSNTTTASFKIKSKMTR